VASTVQPGAGPSWPLRACLAATSAVVEKIVLQWHGHCCQHKRLSKPGVNNPCAVSELVCGQTEQLSLRKPQVCQRRPFGHVDVQSSLNPLASTSNNNRQIVVLMG